MNPDEALLGARQALDALDLLLQLRGRAALFSRRGRLLPQQLFQGNPEGGRAAAAPTPESSSCRPRRS